jgi:microcystin degradation protein MlrC
MKIVIGSIQQETNTFSPCVPSYDDFDICRGEAVLKKTAVTETFRNAGVQLIPTIYANSVPSGMLGKEVFLRLKNELTDAIPRDGIDGIWLYLHGALEAEGIGSGEEAILLSVREKVGYDVPIAVALDFHANNSCGLAHLANIICGYRTAPHTDIEQTQIRAADLLIRCVREHMLPKPVILRVPLMITGDKVITAKEPMRSIISEAEKMEKTEGMLTISVFCGQNWVDAPNTGASIVAIAEDNMDLAAKCAKHLGKMFWEARKGFRFETAADEPDKAVDMALTERAKPVFLTDSGDNTTAGASGDNTYLLKLMMKKGVENVLFGGITDGDVIKICYDLEIGDRAEFTLGGLLDKRSEKTNIVGRLISRGNILGWDGEDAGRTAVVEIPGIKIIVTERRCALISPEIFGSIGINVQDHDIVVVKQGYLYPKLEAVSARSILALTPGASCEAIEKLEFHRICRPVYPLDKDLEWDPEQKV